MGELVYWSKQVIEDACVWKKVFTIVTDRDIGSHLFGGKANKWTNTLLRGFSAFRFWNYSAQSCNNKKYKKISFFWKPQVGKCQLHKVLSINTTISQLPLNQHPPADTCVGRMTRAFQILTEALCARLSPHFNYNCTSIKQSHLLNPYVNMCMYFTT